MQLKLFQQRIMGEMRMYLERLASERDKRYSGLQTDDQDTVKMVKAYDFPKMAWPPDSPCPYSSAYTGDKEPVSDVTIKVPTGGGKTLLACHSIAEIQRRYLNNLCGLVVWIVPSVQIYRQTLKSLSELDHPYRAALENTLGVSSGMVNIVQREEPLSPGDLNDRLTVLMLMLPAANGKTKATLRMYRDAGNYAGFFPRDGDEQGHEELARRIPNLDVFEGALLPQVQTSLANLMRISRPLIVIDEGHKAYSPNARQTIMDFNPSFVLQLTATPKTQANVLAKASGSDLDKEEMIKIPIHITPSPQEADWKTTVLRAKKERDRLEITADAHKQNTGRYIRPICLIQAERTGRDQVATRFIHANQIRDYLVVDCAVPEDQVAIKSSEKDDIENIDLLSESCPIRYIITKQALQEGWDCSFAYMLAILTNPKSRVGMTQLVGRVLRQPDTKRTGVGELDRCRIFSFRIEANDLLESIKTELEKEGLGDLYSRVLSEHAEPEKAFSRPKLRRKFKKYEGCLYLPVFSALRRKTWQPLDFEADILAHVDWSVIDGRKVASRMNLANESRQSDYLKYLPQSRPEEIEAEELPHEYVDPVLMARELTESIPNAWMAWDLTNEILDELSRRYKSSRIGSNFVFILEEARRQVAIDVDRQCEKVFRTKLQRREITFQLLKNDLANALGKVRPVPRSNEFFIDGNTPAKGLLGMYDQSDFNSLEEKIAICLDKQAKLLWWHRMATGSGYRIQGWRRNKIYPDFLASRKPTKQEKQTKIFVIEAKGLHLRNDDTGYKQSIFDLCNNHTPVAKTWHDLGLGFNEHVFSFKVMFEDEWQGLINGLFER